MAHADENANTSHAFHAGACVAALSLLAAAFSPAVGQAGTALVIRGDVHDAGTGRPVPSALILLDNGQQTETDETGCFELALATPGAYRIAAVAPGCRIATGRVLVDAAASLVVRLQVVAASDEGLPAVVRWERSPDLRGAQMKVVTAGDIARMGARTLIEVIRTAAPHMVGQRSAHPGEASQLVGRGMTSVAMSRTPVVIVDGFRIEDRAAELLDDIDPQDVARIEILKGTAGGWIHGPGVANGVIRVYTKQSEFAVDPDTDPDECGFAFPP